jgi:hypothetical protein
LKNSSIAETAISDILGRNFGRDGSVEAVRDMTHGTMAVQKSVNQHCRRA